MAYKRWLVYSTGLIASIITPGAALSKGMDSASIWPIGHFIKNQGAQLEQRDLRTYPAHYISVPVDHFHNESMYEPHSNDTFQLRYWFDSSYYEPGGPVIVLQSGETDAEGRIPFLRKGVIAQLAQATHGVPVVLEHRYYGSSIPTPDLSTEHLRFLTTQQALADQAYFAQNVVFAGLEKYNLTSHTTAYIAYGGSYAGAFVAFLRKLYPEVYWGSIASSGVTEAIYDYYNYYTTIAQHGPSACISATKTLTHVVDSILIGKQHDQRLTSALKNIFQLGNLTHTTDFANVLAFGISNWQSLNWDPAVSSPEVFNYCANVSSTDILYPSTKPLYKAAERLIRAGGHKCDQSLVHQMLNYIGYVNVTAVQPCVTSGSSLDECYTNLNATFYQQDDNQQTVWRSWAYQYCTQWGYLQTGSGVPKNELPLISRVIDLPYTSTVCREAFGIYGPANVSIINQYGGYDISYPRLAIIDGEADPWKLATPHAIGYGAKERTSTTDQPFILIGGQAVHHWDENGLFPNETTASLPPVPVAQTQKQEIEFVTKWMAEWETYCSVTTGCS